MYQQKAIIINDVVKEQRTFEISSQQAGKLSTCLQFELDLQDIEGFGSMFALIGHNHSISEDVVQALNLGAEWKNVWVLKNLKVNGIQSVSPDTKENHQFESWLFESFFMFYETCHPFCLHGEYEGSTYSEMYQYNTVRAIFSSKYDALDFKKIINLIDNQEMTIMQKKSTFLTIVKNRIVIESEGRTTMDI